MMTSSTSRRSTHSSISVLAGLLGVVLAVAGLGVSTTAQAQTQGGGGSTPPATDPGANPGGEQDEEMSVRKRLLYLLSGYHFTPSREDLDAVAEPARVTSELRAIVEDGSLRPSLRGRAVDVLGLYERDEVTAFLDELAGPPAEDLSDKERRVVSMLRDRAILSLAQLYDGPRAVERLEGMLGAEDRQLRLTVVSALGQYAGEHGKKRLREYAGEVDDEIVRDEFGNYVDLAGIPESED